MLTTDWNSKTKRPKKKSSLEDKLITIVTRSLFSLVPINIIVIISKKCKWKQINLKSLPQTHYSLVNTHTHTQMWGLSGKSPAIVNVTVNKNSLCNINVTWQPRRVDWTEHAWTMMKSLMNMREIIVLVSGGSRQHIGWACVLCGCHIPNDWVSRAMKLHQILH